jgi:hypothetical protein
VFVLGLATVFETDQLMGAKICQALNRSGVQLDFFTIISCQFGLPGVSFIAQTS